MAEIRDEKVELLTKSELSIWLDSYDDIFSDFDSRSFSERVLSDDFINEARKISRERSSGRIELKLLMPANKRQKEVEGIIIKSLHTHFRHFSHTLQSEMRKARQLGYLMSLIGTLIMIFAAYLINIQEKSFIINSLRVVMEPAGWFLVWTGLDHIFYISRRKSSELDFNLKMSRAEIIFLSF
jgi:hypothetical protein